MKDFLVRKNNIPLSAYITDLKPSQITTNGALTIIDNTNGLIDGLVPDSNSIFLDNIFLASGYGFSSYENYDKASYIISTYSGVNEYILNEINKLYNKSSYIEYTYTDENRIDKVYNTYGWLTEYKKINVYKNSNNDSTYTIQLETVSNPYISNINITTSDNKDYYDIGESVDLKVLFTSNNIITDDNLNEIKNNGPIVYINNNLVENLELDENNNNIAYYTYQIDYNNYYNQNIDIICERNNNIIYSYSYINAIKWRHKILPFNTESINILQSIGNMEVINKFDQYRFIDSEFQIGNINNDLSYFKDFINNNSKNFIYLDDGAEIEFLGIGYKLNNMNYFTHDYFVILENNIDFDFYFNGIKNNNWCYITFTLDNNQTYRLYQSPQRYIGKHIWTIKYKK